MPNSLQQASDAAFKKLPYGMQRIGAPQVVASSAGSENMRAGVEPGNPVSPMMVKDQSDFTNPDYAPQLLRHEQTHRQQANWPEKLQQQLPAINPSDPYNFGGADGIEKIGSNPMKLSTEQMASAEQHLQAMKQNGETIPGPLLKLDQNFQAVPLSVMKPTDPNGKGINTMPREPGLPMNRPWGTEKLLEADDTVPVKPGSGGIDLSAGLVPKDGGIDLSSGFVDKQQAAPDAGESMGDAVASNAKDLGKGAVKGLLNTTSGIGSMIHAIPGVGKYLIPQEGLDTEKAYSKPEGTAQKIGYGGEQAAEFLAPGLGEESAGLKAAEHLPQIGEAAKPLGRIAYNAATSGAVNKAQGGSFGAGAAGGGIGAAGSEGLRAVAPKIAESALGIRKIDRAYGRTPGESILNETKGVRPETVAESAQERLGELNPELDRVIGASQNPVSLQSARDVLGEASGKATRQNARGMFDQLQPMHEHLNTEFSTGNLIPQDVPPQQALDLKRGFGNDFVHNWNPETMKGVRSTAARTYGTLADSLHEAVPESQPLDKRISSLIPVAKRAESVSLNASLPQKIAGRATAHTGALIGAGLGATEGRREGGIPGMIGGGLTGLLLPEMIGSPTAQMIAARGARGVLPKVAVPLLKGAAMQFNRKDSQ